MKKVIIMFAIIAIATANLLFSQTAQENMLTAKSILEQAENNLDLGNYMKARGIFERIISDIDQKEIATYHLAYCNFKISYIYFNKKETDLFNQYMDEAISLLKVSIKENPNDSESMALLATCYGIKITSDFSFAQSLGEESHKLLGKAIAISPTNPRVLLQVGISKYNTPEFFGGDKEKGQELFKESINQFKLLQNDPIVWGMSDAYAWLGMSLMNEGQNENAIGVFNEGLSFNPNCGWIKYKLLPQAQSSLNTNK